MEIKDHWAFGTGSFFAFYLAVLLASQSNLTLVGKLIGLMCLILSPVLITQGFVDIPKKVR